ATLRPCELRGNEQIDVNAGIIVKIDAVAEHCEGLSHAARATPEIVQRRAEQLPVPACQRQVVQLVAISRVLHTKNSIVEGALVVVGEMRIPGPAVDMARQLLHVVRDAGLLGVTGKLVRQRPGGRIPRFTVARSTSAVAASFSNRVPEKLGNPALAGTIGDFEAARRANDLRN